MSTVSEKPDLGIWRKITSRFCRRADFSPPPPRRTKVRPTGAVPTGDSLPDGSGGR